jgi:hypothetical protein
MKRTVKEQVRSGFRIAAGIVLFFASLMLLFYGLDDVWSATPPGHIIWSAWIGWIEILGAAVLIPVTMHLWLQYFAGIALFAFLKSVAVILIGRDWYFPHATFSRLEAAEIALFSGAALVWATRFATKRPAIPERIAITVYLFCFPHFDGSGFPIWQGVGLAALLFSWCFYRGKKPGAKRQRPPLNFSKETAL